MRAAAGCTVLALALAGCAASKEAKPTVLRTRDFIADPATMPTEAGAPAAAPEEVAVPFALPETTLAGAPPTGEEHPLRVPYAPPADVPSTEAGVEALPAMLDVTATVGAPEIDATAGPAGEAILIDEKVGEINGRPVRVREILDVVGARLQATAREKRLKPEEWEWITGHYEARAATRVVLREEWVAFATVLCASEVNLMLRDELLESEARASLKPQQKQGLAYMMQEAGNNLRRESGGSQAQAERRLQKEEGKTAQQFLREHEAGLLINYQLDERVRKRVRVSWKDVRLYYERNSELYNPPPAARFRLIRVPAANTGAVARVQEALDAGRPFEEVARTADNTHHPESGGLIADPRPFTGDYERAEFNLARPLEEAAHTLKTGEFTRAPVDLLGDKAWLYLDEIVRRTRPLADKDVQLEIAQKLGSDARNRELQNYINTLKRRASFSDLTAMVRDVVDAAAERYWPRE